MNISLVYKLPETIALLMDRHARRDIGRADTDPSRRSA
jgi:hypothetical protein